MTHRNDSDRNQENKDFVMLYRQFIQQIADLGIENPTALRVLLFLIRHMDGMNAIGASQKLISDMVGLSRQTVNACLKYLETHGWISVFKLGKANVYVINPEVVWTSYADEKSFCKFKGTLLLSSEDNWTVSSKDKAFIKHLDIPTISKMAKAEFPDSLPGQLSIDVNGTITEDQHADS